MKTGLINKAVQSGVVLLLRVMKAFVLISVQHLKQTLLSQAEAEAAIKNLGFMFTTVNDGFTFAHADNFTLSLSFSGLCISH